MKKVAYILAAHLIAIVAFGIDQANATTISGISQNSSNIGADFNHDGKVDFVDFSIFAGYWMGNCPANWPF